MKKVRTLLILLISTLFLASTAQALDLLPYFGLKAGKWNQYQRFDEHGNALNDEGLEVAKTVDGFFLLKHYKYEDNDWVYEDHTVIKVTSTKIKWVGFTDDNETWLFTPAMAIPRNLALNKPFVYKGSVVNQNTMQSVPAFFHIIIVDEDLTITTHAQTFTGCIKLISHEVFGSDANLDIDFKCLGRGDVKTYDINTEKTMDPVFPVEIEGRVKDLKAFGNSKPPF